MDELARILIAEDDDFLRTSLRIFLEKAGYSVDTVSDGVEALQRLSELEFDLLLLDVLMPNMDGFEVCTRIRKLSTIPIVILTGLSNPEKVVEGLRIGADDFIRKPVSAREVLVRTQAVLRRAEWDDDRKPNILTYGAIRLDETTRSVMVDREPVHLTPVQYRLLHFLMDNPDRALPRGELLVQVWGHEATADSNLVEVAIRRLREKLECNPSQPEHVVTVRGVGYMLTTPGGDT